MQRYLAEIGLSCLSLELTQEEYGSATGMECAQAIVAQTRSHDRLVLVGTSCSGILIPLVTMLRPIDHLVFICSGLPDVGRSTTEQIGRDGVLHQDWAQWDWKPDDPDAAARFMFNDCEGDVLRWSLSTVGRFFPVEAYDEITPLRAWPPVPMTYLLGEKDRIISQDWARQAARSRLGVDPIELPTGHCPQNSRPELLATVLSETVASATSN